MIDCIRLKLILLCFIRIVNADSHIPSCRLAIGMIKFVAMLLKEITDFLESRADLSLQENYDNSGLITGHKNWEAAGAIICLDSTEDVIDEAIAKGCNLVIAHHPIVFSGLKKFNGKNYVERTIIKAIKHDIAIYAIHTNLDNVALGVNAKIAEMLGLQQLRILQPRNASLCKLTVFVPVNHKEELLQAMFSAGAGQIGRYDECSFSTEGTGTFRAGEGANPYIGEIGKRRIEPEARVEVVFPAWKTEDVVNAMKQAHPYEEEAYEVHNLVNDFQAVGAGMIGKLDQPMAIGEFLHFLKKTMKTGCVRYAGQSKREVSQVAFCGGSGSSLLQSAIAAKADIFVTADFKYHQFFDAEDKIIIADIGHFESEQFTIELIHDWLKQKFPTFATHLTEVVTNPVRYL